MTDALKLLAVFAVGAALGWWLKGRGPAVRRWVVIAIAILIGVPLALLAIAIMISHETLAWIGGLSLTVIGAAAVPLGLGALYRWVCALSGDAAAGACPCSPRDAKPGNRSRQWPSARRGLPRWLRIRVDNATPR